MEELRKTLAEQLLKKFQDGELSLDDEQVCFDRLSLYESAKYALSNLVSQYGDDAFDELTSMHPKWQEERRILLSEGKTEPSLQEISQHSEIVLENDDHIEFTIMAGIFPLEKGEEIIGWAVIRESGIALDREYEIAGIFDTDAEAEVLLDREFDMDLTFS